MSAILLPLLTETAVFLKDIGIGLPDSFDHDIKHIPIQDDEKIEERVKQFLLFCQNLTDHTTHQPLQHGVKRNRSLPDCLDLTLFPVSKNEVETEISQFISKKRADMDKSNQNEFVEVKGVDEVSARTNASRINRSIQLKVNVVHNEEGPLMRTTHAAHDAAAVPPQEPSKKPATLIGLITRVEDLEEYFSITVDKRKDIFSRVKTIEDKILWLESNYPIVLRVLLDNFMGDKSLDELVPSVP